MEKQSYGDQIGKSTAFTLIELLVKLIRTTNIKSIARLAILLVSALSGYLAVSAENAKPNIVVILADDMGYGDSQTFWPASAIHTPNLDRLAATGLKLSNFHTSPLCTASRAEFLSGQGRENFKPGAASNGLLDSVKMLPQFLHEQGYVTGGFGKWHLGEIPGAHPLDRGFDRWIGFHGGFMVYFKKYLDERGPKAKPVIFNGRAPYTNDWTHTTDLFADEAIRFINENKDHPFYVHLAFNAVHGPLHWKDGSPYSSRDDWRQKVAARGVTNEADQDYFAVVEHMDDRIGSVLDCLEKNHLATNTLVLFFSDNGALTRTYYYENPAAGNNGPFRAGKATVYEGGIRVPGLLCWPGVIPAGSVSDQIAGNWDFYPTVYEILGLKMPANNGPLPFRGTSLLALMKSGGKVDRGPVIYEMGIGQNRSAQLGKWKMVSVGKAIGNADKAEQPTGGPLLFDLSNDLGEQHDVSKQHPEVLKQLEALVAKPAAVPHKGGQPAASSAE